eukprot:scaffold110522_cov72-Phaeocystis_antarctica.AAC.1
MGQRRAHRRTAVALARHTTVSGCQRAPLPRCQRRRDARAHRWNPRRHHSVGSVPQTRRGRPAPHRSGARRRAPTNGTAAAERKVNVESFQRDPTRTVRSYTLTPPAPPSRSGTPTSKTPGNISSTRPNAHRGAHAGVARATDASTATPPPSAHCASGACSATSPAYDDTQARQLPSSTGLAWPSSSRLDVDAQNSLRSSTEQPARIIAPGEYMVAVERPELDGSMANEKVPNGVAQPRDDAKSKPPMSSLDTSAPSSNRSHRPQATTAHQPAPLLVAVIAPVHPTGGKLRLASQFSIEADDKHLRAWSGRNDNGSAALRVLPVADDGEVRDANRRRQQNPRIMRPPLRLPCVSVGFSSVGNIKGVGLGREHGERAAGVVAPCKLECDLSHHGVLGELLRL